MDAEWSVAAGADDPVLVLPWRDETGAVEYIDLRNHLRDDPTLIDRIPEARAWPEVRSALLLLNAADSRVWTAKCDAWALADEEKKLDFGPVLSGFGAYFDTIPHDVSDFSSLPAQIAVAQQLTAAASALTPDDSRAEFVLRPARWSEQPGYAMTVYIYGYGDDDVSARTQWAEALRNLLPLVAETGPVRSAA